VQECYQLIRYICKGTKDVMSLRRPITFLLSLTLLCSPAARADAYPTATPIAGYTLRAAPEEIRVFATPNMKANLVGYIIPGDTQEVHVLEVSGDWCFVSFSSVTGISFGYVPLNCLDVAPPATPTPAPTITYAAGTPAWVVNSREGYRLNLREEPSYTARSLGKYYTGAPMILTGLSENGFLQALVAGTLTGWVDERYISVDSLAFVPEMPLVTVRSSTGTILRGGPGTNFERLARIGYGTPVTVLGVRSDGWYHVQVDDQVGYMAETVLSGSLPYGYGMDSDNPASDSHHANTENSFYINTRTSGGVLNLRKSASSTAKSLGKFYTGTPLTILSYTRTGWAYVRIGQTEGYMDADYLTPTQPTQFGDKRIIRNKRANGLNLRGEPSTGGELLTFVPNNSQVIVLGELSDGWCYVSYENLIGYMLDNGLEPIR